MPARRSFTRHRTSVHSKQKVRTAQLLGAKAPRLKPPPTVEPLPSARLRMPPLTLEEVPLAVLLKPALTLEPIPLAVLPDPPLTLDCSPSA